jgi:hypothetical protein
MQYSAAIVESPFQLICAIEYHVQVNRTVIYVRKNKAKNNKILLEIIDICKKSLPDVQFIVLTPFASGLFLLDSIRILKKVDTLLIGDYFSTYMRFFQKTYKKKIVYLDDGIGTLKMQMICSKKLNYFTIFNDIKIFKEKKINNFTWLKKLKSKRNIIPNVVIGSPLINESLCNEIEYFDYMKQVKEAPVIYFPHRNESLSSVIKLEKDLGFEIHKNTRGIEIELSLLANEVNVIYSFHSTASFSLRKIYPNAKIKNIKTPNFKNADIHISEVRAMIERL